MNNAQRLVKNLCDQRTDVIRQQAHEADSRIIKTVDIRETIGVVRGAVRRYLKAQHESQKYAATIKAQGYEVPAIGTCGADPTKLSVSRTFVDKSEKEIGGLRSRRLGEVSRLRTTFDVAVLNLNTADAKLKLQELSRALDAL